ncbi:hypothetical protein ACHAWF_006860 [Thalassiosira exigua]
MLQRHVIGQLLLRAREQARRDNLVSGHVHIPTAVLLPVVRRQAGIPASRRARDGPAQEHGRGHDEVGRVRVRPLGDGAARGDVPVQRAVRVQVAGSADVLGDDGKAADVPRATSSARGALKPAGKAMGKLSMLFKLENKLQAQLLGATEDDYAAARKSIDDATSSHRIVVYTYGLSPFSSEALAVLDEAGAEYENVEVGPEWFLLNREKSALRAELLKMTGQSSLPHVFVDGT